MNFEILIYGRRVEFLFVFLKLKVYVLRMHLFPYHLSNIGPGVVTGIPLYVVRINSVL